MSIVPVFASYEEDDTLMPWEQDDFIPMTASGKQKSPNQIRNELQRYIDSSSQTQTAIVDRMGVNSNSFRKFMNPGAYKNQWNATGNGTYWAAARLLAQVKHEAKLAKKAEAKENRKRKAEGVVDSTAAAPKKSKAEAKVEAEQLMDRINDVELPEGSPVYDSCPELVKKIKAFLAKDGVTKSAFCRALGGINQNSLNPFLMGKNQDQCGNVTYRRAYDFFEKKRILDGERKTPRRLKNEEEHPGGFSLIKARKSKWVLKVRGVPSYGGWMY